MSQENLDMQYSDFTYVATTMIVFAALSFVCAIAAIYFSSKGGGMAQGAAFCMFGCGCFNFIVTCVMLGQYAPNTTNLSDKLTRISSVETVEWVNDCLDPTYRADLTAAKEMIEDEYSAMITPMIMQIVTIAFPAGCLVIGCLFAVCMMILGKKK